MRAREAGAFALGWTVLALALVSPLHRLGETLFAAHMVQHELLMVLAAPLLVLGRPLVPFVWSLPPGWRRVAGSWTARPMIRTGWATVTHPVAVWTLHAIAIWTWHLPFLYRATLERESVHALQHGCFLGTALLSGGPRSDGGPTVWARPSPSSPCSRLRCTRACWARCSPSRHASGIRSLRRARRRGD